MQTEYTPDLAGAMRSAEARAHLIEQYGNICLRCGLSPAELDPPLAVDHIVPVARGGRNRLGNYQLLCSPCNSWKGTQIIDFRPGEPSIIDAGLAIIPNDDRARKSPQKPVPDPVPIIQTIVEKVPVPYLVPLPPPPHSCYDALPRLFDQYTRSQEQVARLSERVGKAEAQIEDYRGRWTRDSGGAPAGCVFIPAFLFVVMTAVAIYFYIY